jgi:uncharacterized protein
MNGANRPFSSMIDAMMVREFYPHRPLSVELKQTHTSCVFVAGDYVYKVKKPVSLAFVDCSTPAKRRALCEREVRLNRRLSPEVYLGVVPIVFKNGGYVLGENGNSNGTGVIDFAIKMLRLPDDRRLDSMLAAGRVTPQDINAIAQRIVSFRAVATDTEAWTYGSAAAVWRLIIDNLSETELLVADTLMGDKLAAVEAYSRHYVSAHWQFLNQRARAGYVRDGHGDLRADCIYLTPEGIKFTDCLEFSDRLRYCDAASEMGFLAMDLDRLGGPELSKELVRYYGCASDDPDVAILMPLYKCYRAMIRAKVDLIRSHQGDCVIEERLLARERARAYIDLACGYAGQACPAGLVVVCGPSGTGKSTLARMLQQCVEFEILSSDIERKRLGWISPTARLSVPYGEGIYSKDFSQRVYESLVEKAEGLISRGKGVILDATFRHRSERALVTNLAERSGLSPVFVECRADRTEVIRRLLERRTRTNEISDATVEIYQAQLNDLEPLDEIPRACHIVADTNYALAEIVVDVERRIRLRGESASPPCK